MEIVREQMLKGNDGCELKWKKDRGESYSQLQNGVEIVR